MKKKIYAGTYTKSLSKGIYVFDCEEGRLSDPKLFCEIRNPKYLTGYGDRLIAVNDFEQGAGVSLIDRSGKIIDSLCFENVTSCYVTAQDDCVYTANYHEGTFSVLKIEDDRLRLIRKILIREKGGCHQVLLHEDKIMVPCLFLDKVMVYDRNFDQITEICFPEGSGPRHGLFSKDGKYLYLVSELSNELFRIDMDTMKIIDQISVLDNGETHAQGTAAIRMSEDGRYLYVSTRSKNRLSMIDAERSELIETIGCGGDHPRDFILLDGCLICANMTSSNVVSLRLLPDGRIGETISEIPVPEAIALAV